MVTYDSYMTLMDENDETQSIQSQHLQNFSLFQHQKTMISKMMEWESTHLVEYSSFSRKYSINTNIGIVADNVGSGKTLEVIGLIAQETIPTVGFQSGLHQSRYLYSYSQELIPINDNYYSNLILVPHTLIHQWEYFLGRTSLTFHTIKSQKTLNQFDNNVFENSHLVILSSSFAKKTFEQNKISRKWKRIIIDEPQSIANMTRWVLHNDVSRLFTWMVCATPDNLLDKYASTHFRNLFNFKDNSIYKLCLRNTPEFVEQSLKLPSINYNTILCYTPAVIRYLGDNLPNKILELINAGCQEEAFQELGCKVNTLENITSSLTSYYQTKIHNIDTRIHYLNQLHMDSIQRNEQLQRLETNRDKLVSKVKGIRERLKYIDTNQTCHICFDECENPMATPCCQNVFCLSCILNSYKYNNNCPMCRDSLQLDKLYGISDTTISNNNKPKNPKKIDALLNILKTEDASKRFLIFSQHYGSFMEITRTLIHNNIPCKELKGSSNSIKSILQKFEKGEIKVILLNANHCGSGLNLQSASDVILYHNIHSSLEKQVVGRAQRCGRTTPLHVHYLKYDNEV